MLSQNHLKIMKDISEGATIWGYIEAKLLREVQQHDENLLTIVGLDELEEITGEEFDGAKRLPYFGAILTGPGRKFIESQEVAKQ